MNVNLGETFLSLVPKLHIKIIVLRSALECTCTAFSGSSLPESYKKKSACKHGWAWGYFTVSLGPEAQVRHNRLLELHGTLLPWLSGRATGLRGLATFRFPDAFYMNSQVSAMFFPSEHNQVERALEEQSANLDSVPNSAVFSVWSWASHLSFLATQFPHLKKCR